MEIKNKTALVLGAIKGIGKGIGLALAREGVNVALNYFDWEESLDDLQQDFAETGQDHLIIQTDLLETDKIQGLVEKVVDRFGRLDILVNNIERGGWPVVHGPYDQKQWDLEMATTLRAKRWVFESALPHLKSSGDAVVLNLS
jgi:3-oxoacyl-[acyl-carrier protein] reductase